MTIRKSNGTKYQANRNISVWWVPANGFANFRNPLASEINAGLNITDSITWDSFDFGAQASNQIDSRSLNQASNAQQRGFAQFGGGVSFYFPRKYDDNSNPYSITYDAMDAQTVGYLVMRVDGTFAAGGNTAAAAGDFVSVYRVQPDAWSDSIDGENPYTYTVTFLPQGNVQAYAIVAATASPALTVLPATATVAANATQKLTASVQGRNVTFSGVEWATSNSALATVSNTGLVKRVAAGSVTITATYPATGVTATATIS